MSRFLSALFALILSGSAFSQPAREGRPDVYVLLSYVSAKYGTVKHYHIEMVEEDDVAGEFSHHWYKTVVIAAMTDGNRYRFEGKSPTSRLLKVSDGKTETILDSFLKLYTRAAAPASGPSEIKSPIYMNQIAMYRAQNLASDLSKDSGVMIEPHYLDDETLIVEGKAIPCYVITGKERYTGAPDSSRQLTYWIQKDSHAIRKSQEHTTGVALPNQPGDRFIEDRTAVFTVADLDSPSLPDSFFKFAPPAEAKLTDEFPDPRKPRPPELVGTAAPELILHAAGGKTVSLAGLRGKPLVVDFWATWCPPCIAALPALEKIYGEASSKGLAIVSIDEDEDEKTGTDFWTKQNKPWQSFYDKDGEIQSHFPPGGMPEVVLIDASGKIAFLEVGFSEANLRAAIAKLGPEYAAMAK